MRSSLFRGWTDSGLTLVEAVISTGMVGLTGAAVATLVSLPSTSLDRVETFLYLNHQVNRFVRCLNDPRAWKNTAQLNSATQCFVNASSGCSRDAQEIEVLDNMGGPCLDYDVSSPTTGFTEKGRLCQEYPSKECPFRFVFRFRTTCANCHYPSAQVLIDLLGVRTSLSFNDQAIDRLVTIPYFPPKVSEFVVTSSHAQGACTPEGWVTRDWGSFEEWDPDNVGQVSGQYVSLSPGRYFCDFLAPAYRVGAHRIRVRDGSSVVLEGSTAFSHQDTSDSRGFGVSYSLAKGELNLAVATNFRVEHYCRLSGGSEDLSPPALGSPVYMSVFCKRVSDFVP